MEPNFEESYVECSSTLATLSRLVLVVVLRTSIPYLRMRPEEPNFDVTVGVWYDPRPFHTQTQTPLYTRRNDLCYPSPIHMYVESMTPGVLCTNRRIPCNPSYCTLRLHDSGESLIEQCINTRQRKAFLSRRSIELIHNTGRPNMAAPALSRPLGIREVGFLSPSRLA